MSVWRSAIIRSYRLQILGNMILNHQQFGKLEDIQPWGSFFLFGMKAYASFGDPQWPLTVFSVARRERWSDRFGSWLGTQEGAGGGKRYGALDVHSGLNVFFCCRTYRTTNRLIVGWTTKSIKRFFSALVVVVVLVWICKWNCCRGFLESSMAVWETIQRIQRFHDIVMSEIPCASAGFGGWSWCLP